jgi:O-antigen ligase
LQAQPLLEKTAFGIYLLVLCTGPLLFGGVGVYGYSFVTLGVLAGSLLLLLANLTRDPKTKSLHCKVLITPLNPTFVLLFVFLLLQILPLPPSVVKLLSPGAWLVGEKSLPASSVVAGGSGDAWFSLAPYTHPVCLSLMRLTVYGLFFLGFSQVLNSRQRFHMAVMAILLLGCFEALYGMIQTFSGNEHIWWVRKAAYRGDVTGTYVNRNHFAGLLEIIIMPAVAYAAATAETRKKTSNFFRERKSFRARLSARLFGEERFNQRLLVLFSAVVMGLALLFSASRGGMLGAAGGLLCLGLLFLTRKGHRRKGLVVLFFFVLLGAYALRMGVERPLERFRAFDTSFEVRARYAQKALELFEDYPLTGIGVGNFRYAYPKYQAPEDTKVFIDHAHNDFVEFLAEAGSIGFVLFSAGFLFYLYRTARLWKRRHDPFAVCLGTASFAALAALGIHSYSDFNLHYVTNCLMLLAVMSIGQSALYLERHHGWDKSRYAFHRWPLFGKGALVFFPLLVLVMLCGLSTFRLLVAEAHSRTAAALFKPGEIGAIEAMRKAVSWNPGEGRYRHQLGLSLREFRNTGAIRAEWWPKDRKELQAEIIRAMESAVKLNPLVEEYHLRLGWEYTYFWGEPDAAERWMPAADLAMERAAYFAGSNNPYLHVMMGDYWLMRSKTVYPDNPLWDVALAKARWHYRKNLSLETGQDRERMRDSIKANVWVHYPDPEFMKRIVDD